MSSQDQIQRATKPKRRYKEEQEEFFNKLSPELAKQCRDVFSNTASKALNTVKDQPGLLEERGLHELSVIMMLLEVTANDGKFAHRLTWPQTQNCITHKAAKRLNLRSEEIRLIVHGVGGMNAHVETKRYILKIRSDSKLQKAL